MKQMMSLYFKCCIAVWVVAAALSYASADKWSGTAKAVACGQQSSDQSALRTQTQDWPEFRGPTGQGHSDERGLPLTWSETKNVRWKVAIPGKGWSSPAIQGDRIWLTTATEEGKSLRAIAVDRNSGAILQNVEVFRLKSPGQINSKNSYASPTPVLDGERVYLHFGAQGTACLTQAGEIVWKTKLDYDNGQHGPGGSRELT